jgi:DNA polymerase
MQADDDPRVELSRLTGALRAELEWLEESGATGLPAASPELIEERRQRQPDVSSTRAPSSAEATLELPNVAAAPEQPSNLEPAQTPAAVPSALDTAERLQRLSILAEQIKPCTRCRLHEQRTQTVFARGTGRSGICFVGEGPGFDEDQQGYPFVGKAGQLLDRMIAAMGFERDDVYVCNIVKCRPPNNRKPEPEEMAACAPYLHEQLELLEPKVIVALGATAVEGLLGGAGGGITRIRGRWRLYRGRVAVMPTFHPAYLLRTPAAKREVWEDLQAVLRHIGRPIPARK